MNAHDSERLPTPPASGAPDAGALDRSDSFRVIKFLGEGGMGRVYLAQHTVLDRRCALKFMPEDVVRKTGWVERFKSEARTLAKLDHPNIVRVYGAVADTASGKYFLEMEYVDGGDLEGRVDRSRPGLPEDEARSVVDEILKALEYAHGQNVIHRDLKPANILLRKDGQVKISDFGLAAVVGEEYHRSLIQKSITLSQMISTGKTVEAPETMMSAVGGTLPYMSPQAKKGEPADPRDDIYAVGVIVYNILTGQLPEIDATSISQMRPTVNRRWDRFFRKCIASRREDRYQTATEARAALASLGKRGVGGLAWAAIALLVVGVSAAGTWYWKAGDQIASPPAKAAVSRSTQSIAWETLPAEVHLEQTLVLAATASSGLPVVFECVSGPATIRDGHVHFTGPGPVTVRATQPGNGNYAPARAAEQSFTVVQRPIVAQPQRIEFPPIPDCDTRTEVIALSATATSELPVAYAVVSGPATLNENRLAITGPGTVVIRATQPGNAFFLPAEVREHTFTVNRYLEPEIVVTLPGGCPMVFKLVPAGEAQLGAVAGELGWTRTDAKPELFKAEVPFYMASTEVTQRQFQALMGRNPSHNRFGGRDDFPVEQVLFADAAGKGGFVEALNAVLRDQGLSQYRAALPTEQEWEYACRAGTMAALNDGSPLTNVNRDPALDRLAIYNTSATAEVGSREPNAWGLHDMHGNVAEWTEDGHLRGGSFRDRAGACRSSARLRDQRMKTAPDERFGLRILLKKVIE